MTSYDWRRTVAAMFEGAALNYAQDIAPVMALLARDLVQSTNIRPGEYVLDIGAGTGAGATEAAQRGARVLGVDISRGMLLKAVQAGHASFVQGDMHQLPLADNTFDLALALFALNSSDPGIALCELGRVLRPAGRLLIQEWDEPDEISEQIVDSFADYCVEEPPSELTAVRGQAQAPIPWDDIETVEELATLVAEAGFEAVQVLHASPVVRLESEALLRYKLAWPIRQAEMRAMSQEIRQLCISDLRENLSRHLNNDGTLDWRPNLIRIQATVAH